MAITYEVRLPIIVCGGQTNSITHEILKSDNGLFNYNQKNLVSAKKSAKALDGWVVAVNEEIETLVYGSPFAIEAMPNERILPPRHLILLIDNGQWAEIHKDNPYRLRVNLLLRKVYSIYSRADLDWMLNYDSIGELTDKLLKILDDEEVIDYLGLVGKLPTF